MPRVNHLALQTFAAQALARIGFEERDAELVATALVEANLRGVDTHGVVRLPQYRGIVGTGRVHPRAQPEIVQESETTAVVDAHYGFGFAPTMKAMHIAMGKAQEHAVGIVGVRNSGHFGAAAYFSMLALARDMIGIVMTNTRVLMPAPGGAEAVVGNNPVSVAVPALKRPPIVLDMAWSVAAFGKVRLAEKQGFRLPSGWALTKDGVPTEDPTAVISDGGLLAPVGGHKGYGLALITDVLSGVLTGAAFGRSVGSMGEPDTNGCGHLAIALSIDRFMPVELFKQRIDQLGDEIKHSRRAPGYDEVLLPGEKEHLERQRRLAEGIPIPEETVADLRALAADLRIGAAALGT